MEINSLEQDSGDVLNLLNDFLLKAKKKGADSGDAIYIDSTSLTTTQRLGATEKLERSESQDIGFRLFVGNRQAIVSSADISKETLDDLTDRGVAMAKNVPEDPHCGLANPKQLATEFKDVQAYDPYEPSVDTLEEWAKRAEDAALSVKGITNSEGAEASWGKANISVIATNGFTQTYSSSGYSLSTSVLAGTGTEMERDFDYTGAVFAEDLKSPEEIGKSAGERAVHRLNPRKVDTSQVPIIYDNRVSRSILSHFSSAINGASIARDSSFLKNMMGKSVFAENINIIDDPHRLRGLRSKPFDGEGLPNKKLNIVKNGALTTWILDLHSGRQLELESTGHASRSISSPPVPSATNLYLESGNIDPLELMNDITSGFYVTELIGFGVNGLTGDYSRGASGFWIENSNIAFPVSEVTIAGNLKDMFKRLIPANDLEFRYGIDAPTIRVDGMTVAGK